VVGPEEEEYTKAQGSLHEKVEYALSFAKRCLWKDGQEDRAEEKAKF